MKLWDWYSSLVWIQILSIPTQAVFAEDRGEAVDTNDVLENTETVNVYNKLSVGEENDAAAVLWGNSQAVSCCPMIHWQDMCKSEVWTLCKQFCPHLG